MKVAVHDGGPLHVHIEKVAVAGPYNLSLYIEGDYCPEHDVAPASGHDHSAKHATHGGGGMEHSSTSECGPDCTRERFVRLLTTLVPVSGTKRLAAKSKTKRRGKKGGKPKK